MTDEKDRFEDLSPGERLAERDRTHPEPMRRPEMPQAGNKYAWLVGILLFMGLAVLLFVQTIPNSGEGLKGPKPGSRLKDFAAPSALGWASQLVRYELLLLAELGFGLDLERCAVTGIDEDLVAVSPRSGKAVSAVEAKPFQGKLLPLPRFLIASSSTASWTEIIDGLALTGHFLARDLLTDRAAPLLDGRGRLVDRLRRAAGVA